MKTLWAPWRMSYILGKEEQKKGCFFDFADEVQFDKKGLLLCRDQHAEVLLNRYPYANGHLLIAPARHLAELTELNEQEHAALMLLLTRSTSILKKHLNPDGFNIGLNLGTTAGAGLADHLHFHVVPRWDGDHNFMTVTSEIRSIPQHIDTTFDLLLPDFQNISKALEPLRKKGTDKNE